MVQKAEKIGNGYQIIIPEKIAEQCGIDNPHDIDVKVHNRCLVIETTDHAWSSLISNWNEDVCSSEMYFG